MELGQTFILRDGYIAKISEIFSQGFNYHTLDDNGNCVKSEEYCLKSDYNKLAHKEG